MKEILRTNSIELEYENGNVKITLPDDKHTVSVTVKMHEIEDMFHEALARWSKKYI